MEGVSDIKLLISTDLMVVKLERFEMWMFKWMTDIK